MKSLHQIVLLSLLLLLFCCLSFLSERGHRGKIKSVPWIINFCRMPYLLKHDFCNRIRCTPIYAWGLTTEWVRDPVLYLTDAKPFRFLRCFPPVTFDVVRSLYIRQSLNFNQNTYIQANENLLQILKHFVCEFPHMSTNSQTDFSYKIGGFFKGVENKSMLKMP